jgi:ATP phosphoribosyltransferase regulatory subunit
MSRAKPKTASSAGSSGELALAEALTALFGQAGYARAEPAVLQPAEAFLDVSGEDIRRRMFVTQDAEGREWALRPEFTIPVCRDHIARGPAQRAASYSYLGPVFRMRAGEPGEFAQAGIESIGRTDAQAADAEVMALICEAVALAGLPKPVIRLGDVAVLNAVLEAAALPASAQRKLMRAVANGAGAQAVEVLDVAADAQADSHAGMLAALEGQDPQAARRFVQDVLAIAGISSVGGRSAGDIASRFLARARERSQPVSDQAKALIGGALAIGGDPDSAASALRALAAEAKVDLTREIDALEARTGFMAARGLDVGQMRFDVSFARNLDYYTSFIFELSDPDAAGGKPVAGGGRYDTLLARLGAGADVPAVGASIWLGRLPGGAS